jgi:hypothetical protein
MAKKPVMGKWYSVIGEKEVRYFRGIPLVVIISIPKKDIWSRVTYEGSSRRSLFLRILLMSLRRNRKLLKIS